ncbi:universal stress protein [Rhodoblastus sp. 17X3]|uniref:universal stress protein n=1 Tax=Rhodoblastus sp. 17X3 TaxID=3047026 RepID=UPI0024B6E9DB|nr:universal stress protein [Rhodoblastus sp. 17X3]MDI9849154.1 universal stress protein [Rhodoblastus sp. 17X3]
MGIKDILVHLGAGGSAESANALALTLAERAGARVTAAAVVFDFPYPAPEPTSTTPDWGFIDYEAFAKIRETRRRDAEKSYEAFASSAPNQAEMEFVLIQAFREKARDDFARLARHFDFLVIAAGGDWNAAEPDGGEDRADLISSALFGSGRPLFIVPPAPAAGARLDKALVCWDGGAQAARALAESLPLLAGAREVEVTCVTGEGESSKKLPGFGITRHLARHGIAATLREIAASNDVGSTILDHAREIGADFLVMGGYGHWRVTELILGGATRTILAASPIPVFMAH